jgi:hypothetical protein
VLADANTGQLSTEAHVAFRVLPVNDAPELAIAQDTAQNRALAASVTAGGTYMLPTLAVIDHEIPLSSMNQFTVTIETTGNGSVSLGNTWLYGVPSVTIDSTATHIAFTMRPDMSADVGVAGTTLDVLMNQLRYTAGAAGVADRLTVTIDDNGNDGSCPAEDADVNDPPPPCNLTSVTTIEMTTLAGTPPAQDEVLTLMPVVE